MSGRKNGVGLDGQENFGALSFGRALAWLNAEDAQPAKPPRFQPVDEPLLHALRERRNQLRAQAHLAQAILETIPECGCESEVALLAGNPDFFLVNFMNRHPAAEKSLEDFTRFFKHINNCFMCFEEYSFVLRDYYHTMQALRAYGG